MDDIQRREGLPNFENPVFDLSTISQKSVVSKGVDRNKSRGGPTMRKAKKNPPPPFASWIF